MAKRRKKSRAARVTARVANRGSRACVMAFDGRGKVVEVFCPLGRKAVRGRANSHARFLSTQPGIKKIQICRSRVTKNGERFTNCKAWKKKGRGA